MRTALLCLLLLICSTAAQAQQANSSSAQAVPKSASDMLVRAAAMSKANRGAIAITLIQEAIRIYPNYFAAHLALGNEFAKAGQVTEALTEYEQARKINPSSDELYRSVGILMMRLKKYDVAASLFTDASVLNPNEPVHHLLRGAALVRQATDAEYANPQKQAERDHILQQARESLDRAAELSGNRLAEVYLFRAMADELSGARSEAANDLEQYLAAKPDTPEADQMREAIRRLRANTAAAPPTSSP